MTLDYQKIWKSMNDLETVSSKICSAREILDSAIESLESGNRQKTETLLYAVDEFLQYYLEDFDRKFKTAWNETVVKLKEEDPCMPPWGHSDLEYLSKHNESLTCDKDDLSPECNSAWTSFWEENYYPEEYKGSTVSSVKQDKVKRWVLPVEEVENGDTGEQEYFITFPDDLLEQAGWKENDEVEWVDRNDGTFILRKLQKETFVDPYKDEMIAAGYEMVDGVWTLTQNKTYNEMIDDGWTMTADGFWIKE